MAPGENPGTDGVEGIMTHLTVWKYTLGPDNQVEDDRPTFRVKTRASTSWLHVGMQRGVLCVWALVDPGTEEKDCTIQVVGTGWKAHVRGWKFIGTCIDEKKGLVWHVFVDR